jgi:4-hydroxybenzoate polyprenyltransferase
MLCGYGWHMSTQTSAVPNPASSSPWWKPRAASARGLRFLFCLRPIEILILQGPPLLGAAFALRPPLAEHAVPLAILVAASICLVAHVFVVNDWSNLPADLADPNRTSRVFTTHGVERRAMGLLAIGLLAAAVLLCAALGPVALGLALGVAACSTLYSLPRFDWKGTPLLNSVAHLVGGTLHFLIGYSLGGRVDASGVVIAAFFALIFTAGHLTQEIRDHGSDVRNGIRTNAVIFGRGRTFAASLILFGLAHALLLALAWRGTVPGALAVLVVFYAIQLRWSLDTFADGFSYASVRRLQARYRALYAAAGVAMVAALWLA